MGIDELPKVTLVAIGAFFPVYLNLVAGIRQTDRQAVELGQVLELGGLGWSATSSSRRAALALLTGLRIGLGQAWLFLVAAELIASYARAWAFYSSTDKTAPARTSCWWAFSLLALLGKGSDRGAAAR